ncbi:sigma-54-dependent transcriptional regulator [Flavitalea sp.]|nr:sigma-54 dependent transcriptional regulator [Flavitalea sp.]
MSGNILIIDDEDQLRKLMSRIISLEGFVVREASTLKGGLDILNHHPVDVILCDVKLPDGNGVDFVTTVKNKFPLIEIILLTAFGNINDGVKSIKNGAFDYVVKGDDNDRIIPLLNQAYVKVQSQRNSAVTVNQPTDATFSSIIGKSVLISRAIKLAEKSAGTDVTVLLLGETGTGKEVFANAIHYNSKRKSAALVAINCSAFSRELLEAELFGYKAGAYTGAVKDKKGLIEVAEGGTLFLDEIGELNIDLQAKLLRVLENGEYYRLGDPKKHQANVRIIAATNRDLVKEIESGHFREDLFYRLNVLTIELPALRERPEDISGLISHFLLQFSLQENKPAISIEPIALSLLKSYSWKGNIRELKNVLERAVILVEGNIIQVADLPYDIQKQNDTSNVSLSLAAVEKSHIRKILQSTNGNKTRAARVLGIGLATLYRKIDEYQLND